MFPDLLKAVLMPCPGTARSELLYDASLFLSEIITVCSCVILAVVECIPSLQVVIMDVEIKQTVGVVNIERNASPFLHLMPCRQRDLLYCLHENGCVSVRVQQPLQLPTAIPMSPFDTKV